MNRTIIIALSILCTASILRAAPASTGQKRTLLGTVDSRSEYGNFWFPENLLAPDMDLEPGELRLDWFHAEKKGHRVDEVKGEVEYSFGSLTLAVEAVWVSEWENADGERNTDEGVEEIELEARYPIFNIVSSDGKIDYTLVVGVEIALPTGNALKRDTEIVPGLFNLLRIGEHFALQAGASWAKLIGPEDGGADVLEYGVSVGWVMSQRELHIPKVLALIPMAEITGEHVFSGEEDGAKETFGTLGFRVNMEAIGAFSPRIGMGYVYPMDSSARDEMRWGVIFSMILEF